MPADQTIFEAISKARIYDLSVEFFVGMPRPRAAPPFSFSLLRTHKGAPDAERDSSAACLFAMGGHTGTHIDALNHIAQGGNIFGSEESVFARESYAGGVTIGAIGETPAIIKRGILLDLPPVKGVNILGPDEAIGGNDLAAAEKMEDVQIGKGDVVLIRTGWMHWWTREAGRYNAPDDKVPGLTISAGEWLADHKVSFTGSDTPNYEKTDQVKQRPVHSLLLNTAGIQIMENMFLDELARDCIYEFIFMALPLQIRGGTASPIRPVAVVC